MSYNTILATAPLTATGYHLKATGTALGQSLIWDNGTNVGIGNTNTSYTLDVSGSLRSTTSAYFATTSGSVGIGTATPSYKFEVSNLGAGVTVGDFYVDTANNSVYVGRQSTTSGDNSKFYVRNRVNTLTALSVDPGGNGAVDVVGTFSTTRGTNLATATGNVGIGTSSPSDKLNVVVSANGNNTRIDGPSSGIIFQTNATSTDIISYGGTTPSYRQMNFATGANTAMSITSGGDVVIGIATAATNVQLNINGYVNKAGRIQFQESGVSKWLVGNGAASENGRFEIYDNTNGTGVQLLRGATSWTALSDERFKDIIEPISVNNKLKNVRAVIGKYKTDNEGVRRNFLIAQDLLKVFPEVVDVDEDETKPMGVRYQDLIPVLVKAIQEQQIQIQNLQEQINILAK